MSITIEVAGFYDHPPSPTYLFVIVTGSQSGTLISQPYNPDTQVWSPSLKVESKPTDLLRFEVFRAAKKSKELMGTGQLCLPRLIEEHENKLSAEYDFDYSIDMWLREEIVGQLRLLIRYDPLMLYEGELTQSVNLSLNKDKEYISFYGGKCDKLNAFSFLDESNKGQYCRFSESVYRDME